MTIETVPAPRTALRAGRRAFNAYVERHELVWELGMILLAVGFVIVGFLQDMATGQTLLWLERLDLLLTVIFVAEFATRFLSSFDRRGYLRGHWIDLIALIPTVRGVRLLRLLRLLRLVRAFAGLYRALASLERLAAHRGLLTLFMTWLAVMIVCSAGLYLAESGVNQAIQSPIDALWWGVVTLTTVGYGDVFPVTSEGRLAAAILMLLGVTLFAAITATITSSLLARDVVEAPEDGEDHSESRQGDGWLEDRIHELIVLRSEGIVDEDAFEASVRRVSQIIAQHRAAGDWSADGGTGRT